MATPRTYAALAAGLATLLAGCSRLSDDELLRGKACASSADCLGGYVCEASSNVCVRGVAAGSDGNVTGVAGASDGSGAGGEGSAGPDGASGAEGTSRGGAGGEEQVAAGGSSGESASGGSDGNPCEPSCSTLLACSGADCGASWQSLAAAPVELTARAKPAFAVGNGKLFIWGGVDATGTDLNGGAIYDVAQDTWELTTITAETPSPRILANAAWTGSGFLVWGGRLSSGASDYRSGAVYDPATGVWTSMPTAGNPRSASIMLSYDGDVLSWGGWNKVGAVLERSQRFNSGSNKWISSTADLLGKREHVGWATRGSRLYMIGGLSDTGTPLADGLVYDMSTTSWSGLQSLPSARYGSFTAHDGSALFSWGGRGLEAAHDDGLVMTGTLWTPISSEAAPSPRWAPHRQSGWSCALDGDRIAVVGGHDIAGLPLQDGGVYARTADAWTATPTSGEAHEWGASACVDGTLVLWGGTHDGVASANGEKLTP